MHSVNFTTSNNMMKLAFALLAVVAVFSPMNAYKIPRAGDGALADELQAFADIIPLDDMVAILLEYVAEDAEFQKLLTYLQSDEFKSLITDIESMPEVLDVINYIQKAGVDVYYLLNKVNEYLGLKKLTPPVVLSTMKITGGIRGFLDDIEAILPVDKIKALYQEKLANSKVFSDLVKYLQSPTTQRIADKVCSNVHFQNLLVKAKNAGVDVAAVKEFLERILGITVPCEV